MVGSCTCVHELLWNTLLSEMKIISNRSASNLHLVNITAFSCIVASATMSWVVFSYISKREQNTNMYIPSLNAIHSNASRGIGHNKHRHFFLRTQNIRSLLNECIHFAEDCAKIATYSKTFKNTHRIHIYYLMHTIEIVMPRITTTQRWWL